MTGRDHHDGGPDSGRNDVSTDGGDGRRLDRREILQLAAASAATTGLAGCSGDQPGTGSPGSGGTDTPVPTTAVPDCESFETLKQGDVNGGATIEAGCYRIEKTHSVDTGTLTLEPGVLIEFAEDAGLDVTGDGALQSNGSATQPVFLQGTEARRGFWQGLRFRGQSDSNALKNTTLAHAGSKLWAGGDSRAAVRVQKATIDVTGSTITSNAGKALNAWEVGADLSVSGTTFESNEIPVWIHADHVGGFDPSNVLENNDDDRVRVGTDPDGGKNEISTGQEWRDPGVAFYVTHPLELTGKLAIQQGSTLDFAEGIGLDVNGGVLVVAGTDEEKVQLRGDQSKRGYWQGIRFRNTTARNVVGHAVLKDAGGALWTGSDYSKAGVFVQGDQVEVVLSRSTFANNDVCGVTATGEGYDLTVANCTFEGNVEPLRVSADLLLNVEANNAFNGNDGSYVRVGIAADDAGGQTRVVRPQTWRALDVPYRLNQDLSVQTDLTVAPGTTVEVDRVQTTNPEVTIVVPADPGGALTADASGGDADPIVFTGVEKKPGHWGGIGFGTASSKNVLKNVVVEYGGGELHSGDLSAKACVVPLNLGDYAPPAVVLEDVTLRGSAKHGIYKECGAALSCTGVSFEDISGADIWDAKLDGPASDCSPTC